MAKIRVRAVVLGFDGMQRRRPGDIFDIEESAFTSTWMKKVAARSRDEEEDDDEAPKQKKPARSGVRDADTSKI